MSLEGIVAFNAELEALVRAQVPLERGLAAAASDYRGRLGQTIRAVAGRLEAGDRLSEAVAEASRAMPEIYRAVIEAGVRSGRLAEALQGLTQIGQAQIEARRAITLAFFYPLLVLALGYALFLGCLAEVLPRFLSASVELGLNRSPVATWGERLSQTMAYWGPVPPLIGVGLLLIWVGAGRSRSLNSSRRVDSAVSLIPWVGRILANYRTANFADLLAHLIDHEVPLDGAVRLAGDAAGSGGLRQAAAQFADRLATGHTSATNPSAAIKGFPPLIAWMLTANDRQATLAPGLRHLGTAYRRKADRQADAFQILLPGLLLLTIGAGTVLAYGLLLFIPLQGLWTGLAIPGK